MIADWALDQLDLFIRLTSYRRANGNSMSWTHQGSPDDIRHQLPVAEQILDRVHPEWRKNLVGIRPYESEWKDWRDSCIEAKSLLVRDDELRENLGENAPDLSAADLHPWIWSGARSLWQSNHYVQAVRDAATKLNAETQNKVGRRDVSETDLFKQSFSLDDPKPAKARLRRMKPEDGDTYRSVQRGAMTLAEGVFAGIRNPLSHEADQELSEQEALEYLAALSVLARWVDSAEVEVAT